MKVSVKAAQSLKSSVAIAANICITATLATTCKPFYMNRFVSITTYAKICKITRPAVYKRIKSGKARLLEQCEVPVIDLAFSRGEYERNNWKDIQTEPILPF